MHKANRSLAYRSFALGTALALAACGRDPLTALRSFTIAGAVTGLNADGLILLNNGGDDLTVPANAAAFQFATPVRFGGHYSVAVFSQPTGLTCSVGNGQGNHLHHDIVNVRVACSAITFNVGGTIAGLTGSGLVLRNSGDDDLTIPANATTFEFATPVAYGSQYAVTVATQPFGQSCVFANASGIVTTEVGDVTLTCAPVQFVRFEGHNALLSSGRVGKDPGSGSELHFVFVDNTSSSAPDGSAEHPYPTLALAQTHSQADQIIYVFPGDGTTAGMDAGIALQARQRLWGAGTSHDITTSEGAVTISASASTAPKITNTAGDGITLAMDNEISGFELSQATDNGISGNDPKSVSVTATVIDQSQLDAIHLVYSTAPGPLVLDGLTLTNGAQRGISIDSTIASSEPPMRFTLSNSVIQGFAVESVAATFTSEVEAHVTGNTVEGNGYSSTFDFAAPATLSVSGNAFNNNIAISGAPFVVTAGATSLSAVIESNTVSGNAAGALHFALNGTDADIAILGNTITHNGTGSIASLGSAILIAPDNTATASLSLVLDDNTISNNDGNALFGFNGSFDDLSVSASGNTLAANGGGGLIFADAANTFTLTATDNTITGGGDHGIATAGGRTMATAHLTLSRNSITGNANSANGISLNHDGTRLDLTAADNLITGNEGSGILLYSANAIANLTASLQNNTVSDNQNLASNAVGGIDLEQFTSFVGHFSGNTLSNNATSGLWVGSTEPSPEVCWQMSGNSSDTGYTLSSGTGVFNLAPADAMTANTGVISTIGAITLVASCP